MIDLPERLQKLKLLKIEIIGSLTVIFIFSLVIFVTSGFFWALFPFFLYFSGSFATRHSFLSQYLQEKKEIRDLQKKQIDKVSKIVI